MLLYSDIRLCLLLSFEKMVFIINSIWSQALDFVIYEAKIHHVRLILSLVNDLNAFGGKAQHVMWAQAAGVNVSASTDSFFSHPTIKGHHKDYVKVWW